MTYYIESKRMGRVSCPNGCQKKDKKKKQPIRLCRYANDVPLGSTTLLLLIPAQAEHTAGTLEATLRNIRDLLPTFGDTANDGVASLSERTALLGDVAPPCYPFPGVQYG